MARRMTTLLGISGPLFALGLVAASTSAPATDSARWGRDGHRMVCWIAAAYLTDEAAEMVEGLLGREPLGDACTWADEVRGTIYPETAPLHYVNFEPGMRDIDLERDCPNGCVLSAISRFGAELADESLPAPVRTEALKFLAHFVGDLHQPLHVGYGSDRGGNDVNVRYEVDGDWRTRTLHSFWDSGIIDAQLPAVRDFVNESLDEIGEVQRLLWSDTDVERWALESFRVTERFVYASLTPVETNLVPYVADASYLDWARDIMELRLRQGGIRLAHLLNEIAAGRSPF